MPETPIEDYAILGDTRTAALVSREGSIDWLCAPRFDSPPVFGALIGGAEAGRFELGIRDAHEVTRRYRDASATLETRWVAEQGTALVTDGMILDVSHELLPQLLLVRHIRCTGGRVQAEVHFDPRRDLGPSRGKHARRAGGLAVEMGHLAMSLHSTPDLALEPGKTASLTLEAGNEATFVLGVVDRSPLIVVPAARALEHLAASERWFRSWSSRIAYDGPGRDKVVRSLITLRLMTFAPSGAPVAAPTTSLPEEPGGVRNWDYRFAWPRDASMGVTAFLGLGLREEGEAFLHWLTLASRLTAPRVQVFYDLLGRPGIAEDDRLDVPGYAGSLPVRIGNAACHQHQLDVYGWIVEAAWQLEEQARPLDPPLWRAVQGWASFAADRWRDPDAGIWERRDRAAHHVHSKLMGWQALDRALTLAERHPIATRTTHRWESARLALAEDIRRNGVDPARDVFVGRYGEKTLDAAVLMLPMIGFEDNTSPRVVRTVEAIRDELDAGGGLLYRYPPGSDGLPGGEGAFLACSFWLVQALCRLGRVDEARALFESLCSRSNDVGLFAEQIDPSTGAHLGNFPQALTHASLVEAALALVRVTEDRAARRA